MTYEAEWRREWEVLRAERAAARRQWRSAADGLAARARDPLGLGGLVRDHPIAATGIGAAAGALLVKFLVGRRRARQPDAASNGSGTARPESDWVSRLRDAAVRAAVPLILRMLTEKFGKEAAPAAAPDPAHPHTTAAEPGPHAARS